MSQDLMAWRANCAITRELSTVDESAKPEYIELLAAGALIRMRELFGDEYVRGFLIAANAELPPRENT